MEHTNIYIFILFVILIGLVANYFLNKNKRELDRERNAKKAIRPGLSKKNKWLFPEDEFGKMEKGRTNVKDSYGGSRKK
jgi:hypothetical protein